tara:strand:- start:225 stop:560 length:336 start_codon:yes stop_codon:yes gene_type:complete
MDYRAGGQIDLPDGEFEVADLFSDDQIITLTGETTLYDNVSKPAHYNLNGGIECIDYIEQVLTPEEFKGYCKGNSIKYQHREGYKGNPVEDMQKSQWYQNRAIQKMKEIHK